MHKVREIEQHNCFKRLGIFRALKNPNENRVALSRLIFRSWVYLSFWSLNVWRWGLEDEGNRVDTILGSVCVNSDDGQERKKKRENTTKTNNETAVCSQLVPSCVFGRMPCMATEKTGTGLLCRICYGGWLRKGHVMHKRRKKKWTVRRKKEITDPERRETQDVGHARWYSSLFRNAQSSFCAPNRAIKSTRKCWFPFCPQLSYY